ncbi:hypothetical protein, partial [Streptococcus agalactiae]|uniref:hypothetical protein n=1 Tax=Streptococcus agalactiae TaxID=1311 RepID=UPI001C60EC85
HRAWYWLIPFADGRASFGVVAEQDFFDKYMVENAEDNEPEAMFKRILADEPSLSHVLRRAKFDTPVRTLVGYSANVKHLAGHNYHRAWYWLIPFADGRASFGVVAEQDFFDKYMVE